jgi:hypothetical protein
MFQPIFWSPDNRYLAYFVNLDDDGGLDPNHPYPELQVYDLTAGLARAVCKSVEARFSFSWSPPHTLLFSALPLRHQTGDGSIETRNNASAVDSDGVPILRRHPDIYAVSALGGTPMKIIEDGFRPCASRDGKRIAFFGSEDLTRSLPLYSDWEWNPRGSLAFEAATGNGRGRTAFEREEATFPDILWLDNRDIVTIKATGYSPDGLAQVQRWDIATGRFKLLAELPAKDIEPIPRSLIQPQFRGLAVALSGKSKYVIVRLSEMFGSEATRYDERTSIEAVDASTGAVFTLAQVNTSFGVDWWTDATPHN